MLIEIPDVLSKDEVQQCMEHLSKATWQDGRATAGQVAIHAKNNEQLALDDPLAQKLGNFILDRLAQIPRFIAAALPLKVLPPRFNRYTDAGNYGNHIDNAIFSIPGTPHRVRSDLSATLFLSEPDSYEGGELVMDGSFGRHSVKLPAGHMILYPSTTLHQVTAVTKGARIAAFFWIQSMVREDHRRALLLELDDTIQALAMESPDSPQVVRLTGLYHNLLREWADT